MVMRWYYRQLGGHIHVRVFTGKAKNMTFAKCGDLTLSIKEWDDVRNMLHHAVELLDDECATEAVK